MNVLDHSSEVWEGYDDSTQCRRQMQRTKQQTLGNSYWHWTTLAGHVFDVPFELVSKIACASAMAEASHVQGSSTSRHERAIANSMYTRRQNRELKTCQASTGWSKP
jgi:hypothetical protein